MKVLVYGYCMGVTSSRKLAAGCENEVALRYLTANQQPDFRTISDFRKDHLSALNGLFVEVLGLCMEAGLVNLGRVAMDGRKMEGNASLDQNRDEEWLQEEDAKQGKERRGDELPQGLRTREERRTRLEAALGRIEEKKQQAVVKQEQKIEERRREETVDEART